MPNMRSTSTKMRTAVKYYGDSDTWERQKGRRDWSFDRRARKCGGEFKERVAIVTKPPRG